MTFYGFLALGSFVDEEGLGFVIFCLFTTVGMVAITVFWLFAPVAYLLNSKLAFTRLDNFLSGLVFSVTYIFWNVF